MRKPKVFISYSHRDEAWKDRIHRQLAVLGDVFALWDDRRIAGGDAWQAEIETALAECDVALLLISADFLTSGFILGEEVPVLLRRRESEGLLVIPVILKPCAWERVGWLRTIQARPLDGTELSGMSEHEQDRALAALAGEVADRVIPEGSDRQSPSTVLRNVPQGQIAQDGNAMERELRRVLAHCGSDPRWTAFMTAFMPGTTPAEYVDALRLGEDPCDLLTRLNFSLRPSDVRGLGIHVVSALALSALLLYQRCLAVDSTLDGEEIGAANLLLAAVHASACYGTDTVVQGEDIQNRDVSNRLHTPNAFQPYRHDEAEDTEWEEIKRSISWSIEALLDAMKTGDLSHRKVRVQFDANQDRYKTRHLRITDDELRRKLTHAHTALGGRYVYFIAPGPADELVYRHRERVDDVFGIRTVVWTQRDVGDEAAGQIEDIFDHLFQAEASTPPPQEPGDDAVADKGAGLEANLNAGMDRATATVDRATKLFRGLAAAWQALKGFGF